MFSNLCHPICADISHLSRCPRQETRPVGVDQSGKGCSGVIDEGKVDIKRHGRAEQADIAAKLRHHHLLSLVGYCKEENENIGRDQGGYPTSWQS
jgi:hypothetical protein